MMHVVVNSVSKNRYFLTSILIMLLKLIVFLQDEEIRTAEMLTQRLPNI